MQRLLRILHILLWLMLPFSAIADEPPDLPINTYWHGAGDTPGMEYYRQSDQFLRFTAFPVRVYLSPDAEARWRIALHHTIRQLKPIIPVQRVAYPALADIQITLFSPVRFEAAPCDAAHEDGCGFIQPLGLPGDADFRVRGMIWINRETTLPAQHLLLHEMLHALGLLVHSPDPHDVMFNGDTTPIRLSERDLATLRYLYQQPAWGED